MIERTLVLIKPDAVRRNLTGQIIDRYLARGLSIVALEMRLADADLADRHYAEHTAQPWYPPLRDFITSGPLIAAIIEGEQAVAAVRATNGATNAIAAAAGTIRGDLALSNRENLVHGSDSVESATREIAIWFPRL